MINKKRIGLVLAVTRRNADQGECGMNATEVKPSVGACGCSIRESPDFCADARGNGAVLGVGGVGCSMPSEDTADSMSQMTKPGAALLCARGRVSAPPVDS